MNKVLLIPFFCFFIVSAIGQTTVNRKVAQRYDEYNNSTWEGKDSVLFNYNSFGLEINRQTIKGTGATTWNNFYRSTSAYDANGNPILQIREFWDGTTWLNNSKFNYTYNSNNQQTLAIYQTWNSSSNSWVNTGRIVNTYNSNNLLAKIETDSWNGSWTPTTKQDWYYNSSNELMTKETYKLVNSNWEGQSRFQYVHAFGFVSNLIESIWSNGSWELNRQVTSLINGSVTPARIVSRTNYYRNLMNNTWGYIDRTYFGYTSNLLTTVQSESYDTSSAIWRNTSLITNSYNANNLLSEEKTQQYNIGTSTYDNDVRKVLTYNGSNLNDQITHTIGVGSTGWVESGRDKFTYNSNDSLTYWLVEEYVNSNYAPLKQHFYYYDAIVVGLNNLNNLFVNATLYPNPSTDNIYIKTNETLNGAYQAVIYSMNGKRIWSQLNTNPNQDFHFDISILQAGNYVLQLNEISSGKTQHFKLNKQ